MSVHFSWPVRVYYHHTDAGGVVYHGRYLDFLEAARTELIESLGFDLTELATKDEVLFMVYALAVEFRKPALLNDMLTVTASVGRLGRARIVFDQTVMRDDETLVSAEVSLACVHPQTYKPVPMPDALRERIEGQ